MPIAAEVALAGRGPQLAQDLVRPVLAGDSPPEIRCQALALLGRIHRNTDLDAASDAFQQALSCAESGQLPLWQMRALHELGTIELFDHAGLRSLIEARARADDLGALSTVAVLDIQLAAAHLFRFEPGDSLRHDAAALAAAERLRLDQLRATALVFQGRDGLVPRRPGNGSPQRAAARR